MQPPPANKTLGPGREVPKRCPNCGQRFPQGDGRFCPRDGTALEPDLFAGGADPLVGTIIDGRYEVLERLGEGGTGRVYRARHTAIARPFAVKVLRHDLARDEELAARFIQEAKATASVRHPNVVEITDFGRLPDGVPYFVMDLLVGRSLTDVIRTYGSVPPSVAVPILVQVAHALGAAHAKGIVHRDLKPDNVFLVGDHGDVRVVDFGAAKVAGAHRVTRDGVVLGTPHYMSPEQASGQPIDHRADIYSLGVIMYEMFAGRVPFEADTYMGVLTQHMFVQPVPPSQANPAARELGALERITLGCLAKKPDDRYPSMDHVAVELEAALGGPHGATPRVPPSAPTSAGPQALEKGESDAASATDSIPGLPRRYPWAWAISGAVVVGGLVLAAASHAVDARPGRLEPPHSAPQAGADSMKSGPQPYAPDASAPARTAPAASTTVEPAVDRTSQPSTDAGQALSVGEAPRSPDPASRGGRPTPARPGPRLRHGGAAVIDDIGDPFTKAMQANQAK